LPEYNVPFTGVIGVGSPVGAQGGIEAGGGRSPASPQHCSRPTPGPHRSINIASGGAPKTSQNGWRLQGERDRGRAMADRPADDGSGNCRAAPSPPCRTPLDNRSTLREDGRAKRRAAAGSPAPWCTCQKADMQCNRGRDRRPAPGHQVWETTGLLPGGR